MKIRYWEQYWQENTPRHFLTRPKYTNHPLRQFAYKTIIDEGGSLLDAGCCSGRDYPLFVENGIKYTGIDITKKFIVEFRRKHPDADVRVASVLDLPFEDKTFNSVFSGNVIQHMHPTEYHLAIKEMWRVVTNLMVLVIPPFIEKEVATYINRVYRIKFDKKGLLKIINNLNDVKAVELKENIKDVNNVFLTTVIVRKDSI